MAEAVQNLFPGTQVTIGPNIENGFFYDFARAEPFTPWKTWRADRGAEDAPAGRQGRADRPRGLGPPAGDRFLHSARARPSRPRSSANLAGRADQHFYRQGDWLDLCLGPHMPSTGKVGQAFKLTKLAGAYWRRGDSSEIPMLAAHLARHRLARPEGAGCLSPHAGGGRKARPSPARPGYGSVPCAGGEAVGSVFLAIPTDGPCGGRWKIYLHGPGWKTAAMSRSRLTQLYDKAAVRGVGPLAALWP